MTPSETLDLLTTFYRETLALTLQRQTNALSIAVYDANNAYQQVLGRQDVHLRWLADAVRAQGGTVDETPEQPPAKQAPGKAADAPQIIAGDLQAQRAFLDRWKPRVAGVTNARHRKMLGLILGEMSEHLRAFQQTADGRTDVLGRHTSGKVLSGQVLAGRPRG